jgi:hypothetical protein
MKLLRFSLLLSILFSITINNSLFAQDSTRVVKLANAVLKNFAPEKIVYNKALLLKGEEGTDLNMGQRTILGLQADNLYTITIVIEAEEDEQLNLRCGFIKGDAETETPVTITENIVITKVIQVDAYAAFSLAVKKTNTFTVFVGGRKLPAEGVYYKLIVTKL